MKQVCLRILPHGHWFGCNILFPKEILIFGAAASAAPLIFSGSPSPCVSASPSHFTVRMSSTTLCQILQNKNIRISFIDAAQPPSWSWCPSLCTFQQPTKSLIIWRYLNIRYFIATLGPNLELNLIWPYETSPPSAREAAMSAMRHETFLKHLESFLENSMKHSGNTLENHETPLKHPWNFFFHETPLKFPWNTLKTPSKHPWNFL